MKKVILILTTLLSAQFSFGQWEGFSLIPNSDPIQCVAARGSMIVAGTQNGIYISNNGGVNWTNSIAGLTDFNIKSLMITGSNIISGSSTGKIAYRPLSGTLWTVVNSAGPDYVSSFFKNGTVIWAKYLGGPCKTYQSTDNGVSWSEINFSEGSCFVNYIRSNGYLFKGDWEGPRVSTDNGATWTSAHNGYNLNSDLNILGADELGHIVLSRGYIGGYPQKLYYATASSNPTWQYANGFLNNEVAITSFAGISNFIYAGVNNTTTFFDNGVQFSTNGGVNWTLDNAIMGGVNCLAIDSVYLYAGSQEGKVWKKTLMITTSTNDISTIKNSTSIYPNPSSGQFTIEHADKAEIMVTDLLGHQILQTQTTEKSTALQLDKNGVYIVYVKTNQGTTTQKLVVSR